MLPLYDYADAVRVTRNIHNDGTYPGEKKGALLIRRGSIGYVQNVGTFLQDQIIYTINFLYLQRVVGCRETELISKNEIWVDSQFDFRDTVYATKQLSTDGKIIVEIGQQGEIVKVFRNPIEGVYYHVWFDDHTLLVPECALRGADCKSDIPSE